MSQTNVEIYRTYVDDFLAGASEFDPEATISKWAEFWDPEVEHDTWSWLARSPDAPLRLRWIAVTWFHDGKATRSAGYANRHEALKAVGLEE